ncbi:MAG: polysaccharide deacetylase family protein, partial [Chthoniobacterales bacterium]
TMTHPAVSRLDESDLREELADSKHLIESRLQGPVVDFAFPFGKPEDISPAAQSYLAQCGYRSAVSTTEGYNYPGANPFSLRRMQIGDGAPIADFSLDLCLAFLMGQTMPDQIVNEPSEACVFRRIKELQGN